MNRVNAVFFAASIGLVTSCASLPRDAGISVVQETVSARNSTHVEWKAQPATSDDDRVRAMLHDELTADDAVAIAMMNNPRLQATLAELGVARADLIQASTITNPIFEAELRFPGAPYHPYELRLAQSLIELIQLPRRRAIGRAAFDAAQMRVSSEVLRFAADVRSDYVDLLAAAEHLAMSRTVLESAKTAAELAVKQHEAENITDLDLENEQAMYEQAKLDLSHAEKTLVIARETFIRALGLREPGLDWRLPDGFPELPKAELDQEQLQQLAAAQRLDIAIARREVEIAEKRVPAARLAALGDIEGDVHLEREPQGQRTWGPGILVPFPIFNSGRAARSRAEAELIRARHVLNALQTEFASQVRAGSETVAEARARVEYYRDVMLPRRARIVELTKLEHNAMLVGVFQLLQAKQNEAQAHRAYIEAQREYWSARTNLDRVVNGVEMSRAPANEDSAGQRADARRGGH